MKYWGFYMMVVLLAFSCEEEEEINTTPIEAVKIEGFEKFNNVYSGIFMHDTTYWMVTAIKLTNTALISTSFQISVKKQVLRTADFPLSLQPEDFSIVRKDSHDEPGGQITSVKYDTDETFVIHGIKGDRIHSSFSAASANGNVLTGEFSWLQFNFECPVTSGYIPPCPLDPDFFKPVIFSVEELPRYSQVDLDNVDPTEARIYAYFVLPIDTSSLHNNFLLFENGIHPVEGIITTRQYGYAYFSPKNRLRNNTPYTAKVLTGVRNAFNGMEMQQEYQFSFKTGCVSPLVGDIPFGKGLTVQLADSIWAEDGVWTIVEGTGGTFTDNTSSNTKFTGSLPEFYRLRWVPSNGCEAREIKVDLRPTVSDYEGNLYHMITIGNQVWLGENLRSQKDANGRPIPSIKERGDLLRKGRYYPWWVAMNESDSSSADPSGIQGICPNGWHLPSEKEFQEMMDFASTDGRPVHLLLKDSLTWDAGLDAFNFKVINTGTYDRFGRFSNSETLIWATNKVYTSHVSALMFADSHASLYQYNDYQLSASVRCVKN